MRSRHLLAASGIAATVLPAADFPKQAPQTSLNLLQLRALEALPELRALRHELAAQKALVASAGVLADPQLEVEVQSHFGSPPEASKGMVHWIQAFPPRNVRKIQRQQAQLAVERLELELARAEAEARAQVLASAVELYVEQSALVLLKSLHRNLEDAVAATAQLLATGEANLADWIVARRNLSVHQREIEEVQARVWQALAKLRRVTAWPENEFLPDLDALPNPGVVPSAEQLLPQAYGVRLAEIELRIAATELELARAELRSGWSFGAGLVTASGSRPAPSIRWGIELPVFRRERELPRIESLAARVQAAASRLEAARLEAQQGLLASLTEINRSKRLAALLEREVIPLHQQLFEAQTLATAGARPLLADTELVMQEVHNRLDLLRAQADAIRAWSELVARFELDLSSEGVVP